MLVTTDQAPILEDWLNGRQRAGLDRYDYWDLGVYVVVTGPSPEHNMVASDIQDALKPAAKAQGLVYAPQINIGIDKQDCRVPDAAVFDRDTPRTSAAFLATALLVVEVLSPDETPQAKLDFYARWHVAEYLEADPAAKTVRLWRRDGEPSERWVETQRSGVLDLDVDAIRATIIWP